MKSHFIAFTTLSCICLGLSSVAPAHSIHPELAKGGDGHHEHSTPHSSDKPETDMPMHDVDETLEVDAEAATSGMTEEEQGASHHNATDSEVNGGASSDAHHGGAHGHHGSMPIGQPWFHHGAIEVSEVFHLALANIQEPSTDMAMERPSVMVMVHPDTRQGWNIEVQTEHFSFTPEQVNQANQPNVGHGHLYVDGEKIARLYGSWFHLEALEPGTHEITVSLHANGHEVWTHKGEAIAHTVTIEVP